MIAYKPARIGSGKKSTTFKSGIITDDYNDAMAEFSDIIVSTLKTEHLNAIRFEYALIKRIRNVFAQSEHFIKKDVKANLTSYSKSGTLRRSPIVTEMFKYLNFFVGFEFNPSGSFTDLGAKEVMEKCLSIKSGALRLDVEVLGRLLELEKGIVNWHALRTFFFNPHTKRRMYDKLGDGFSSFYGQVNSAFKKSSDTPRPYVSSVLDKFGMDLADDLYDEIKEIIRDEGFEIVSYGGGVKPQIEIEDTVADDKWFKQSSKERKTNR